MIATAPATRKFVTLARTVSAVEGRVPAPYVATIDGTPEVSEFFRSRRDNAVNAVVREINALSFDANEAYRLEMEARA